MGLWSSVAVTAAALLFAAFMAAGQDYGAYGMSVPISWAYLVMACSFAATSGDDEKALAGVAFGLLYGLCHHDLLSSN